MKATSCLPGRRREFCQFADNPLSIPIKTHLLKGEGGRSRTAELSPSGYCVPTVAENEPLAAGRSLRPATSRTFITAPRRRLAYSCSRDYP